MGYAQWVHVIVQYLTKSGKISVQDSKVMWGKFYKWDNKDNEISGGDVEKETAGEGAEASIASCGRSDASSGTEGVFDLYDGSTKICHVYWNCPWGSKTNTFTVSDINNNYMVQHTGASLDSGALGTVTVKVVKLG
ncbi:aegerolysin type hemolysin [Stachybotrys elegans]|uniref:Aegerolysin type hemolysin n=1 Tax=Stachybotrys elegans TaxID=80388 RepID=A0A8K0SZ13_9HYPO|nr:aegerolysin type hemolysin [Stachybotrys elegans]